MRKKFRANFFNIRLFGLGLKKTSLFRNISEPQGLTIYPNLGKTKIEEKYM